LVILLFLGLGILILFIFSNKFEKKITVLDCESFYYKKLFERPKPNYLDVAEDNAKVDVAICLCEKYMKNKANLHKKKF
jgi:hypothetical protein